MLYRKFKVNKIIKEENLWVTQKNIGEDVKWARRRDELEKETKKNRYLK